MTEKSSNPFNPGDVVSLRSGSSQMTVSRVAGSSVDVVFYNPITGVVQRETFWYEVLRNASTRPETPYVPQPTRG